MKEREVYAISDLHLGAGAGDDLEDFHADELLATWLRELSPSAPTLIINGDFIDFLQIAPFDVSRMPRALLWDEETSLAKLEAAIAGHPVVFDALGELLGAGGELVITVGNHDLDLVWDSVEARIAERVSGPADRFTVRIGAYVDRGLRVEHGYHFTPENSPRNPTDFVRTETIDGTEGRFLERVWGSDFVLRFLNDIELKWRFIDNAKPTSRVLYAGLREGWIPKRELVRFAVFVRLGMPWRALGSVLDGGAPPQELLYESFDDPELNELVTELFATGGAELEAAVAELPPEDRAALRERKPATVDAESFGTDGPAETLGLIRRSNREERAARDRLEQGADVVVFGHTHRIVDGNQPDAKVPELFNPGSWVPHLRLSAQSVQEARQNGSNTKELLGRADLYVLDTRAVHCVVTDDGVQAQLEAISDRYPDAGPT